MRPSNIFLFFFDNEIHKLYGIKNYRKEQIIDSLSLATKFAILYCSDSVYIPLSNYLESDISFELLNNLALDTEHYNVVKLLSSSNNIDELLERKKAEHASDFFRKGYHYQDFLQNDKKIFLPGTMVKRTSSASKDILTEWTSDNNNLQIAKDIFETFPEYYHGINLEQLIGDIPKKIKDRAIISGNVTRFFNPPKEIINRLDAKINHYISSYYIGGFLHEYQAVCLKDIPFLLSANALLPDENMYQHISYNKCYKELQSITYRGENALDFIKRSSIQDILEFKESICFKLLMSRVFENTYAIEKGEKKAEKMDENKINVTNNLIKFWEEKRQIVLSTDYSIKGYNPLSNRLLDKKLSENPIVVITANSIEGQVLDRYLMEKNDSEPLDRIVSDEISYVFGSVKNRKIVHIWQGDTGSKTPKGSYNVLKQLYKRHLPQYLFSVGVAYGQDYTYQQIGDVLIADHIIPYDIFNKKTDGKQTLNPDYVYKVNSDILAGCNFINQSDWMKNNMSKNYNVYFGTIMCAATVLSDQIEKEERTESAKNIGRDLIGGEMESSGIYEAGIEYKNNAPSFLIIKGICDWGVCKNGWDFACVDPSNPTKIEKENIKNHVQAYACNNAIDMLEFIIEQIIPVNCE